MLQCPASSLGPPWHLLQVRCRTWQGLGPTARERRMAEEAPAASVPSPFSDSAGAPAAAASETQAAGSDQLDLYSFWATQTAVVNAVNPADGEAARLKLKWRRRSHRGRGGASARSHPFPRPAVPHLQLEKRSPHSPCAACSTRLPPTMQPW